MSSITGGLTPFVKPPVILSLLWVSQHGHVYSRQQCAEVIYRYRIEATQQSTDWYAVVDIPALPCVYYGDIWLEAGD